MKFAILCFFVPFTAFSQSPTGMYAYKEAMVNHQIRLLDSAAFIKSSSTPLGHGAHFEKGHYTRNGDTLLFKFEPYKRPKGTIEVINKDALKGDAWEKNDRKEGLWLKLQLRDIENTPITSGPSVVDLVSKDSAIATINIHSSGHFEYYATKAVIDELHIRSLGFEKLKLSLRDFMGFKTTLDIILIRESPDTFGKKRGEATFLLGDHANYLQSVTEDGTKGPKYLRIPNRD